MASIGRSAQIAVRLMSLERGTQLEWAVRPQGRSHIANLGIACSVFVRVTEIRDVEHIPNRAIPWFELVVQVMTRCPASFWRVVWTGRRICLHLQRLPIGPTPCLRNNDAEDGIVGRSHWNHGSNFLLSTLAPATADPQVDAIVQL